MQSSLLIIDTIMLPGVVSPEGTDLVQSLLKLNRNIYQPVPTPEFIPADFGEASRIQHLINVALTALCNCKNFQPLVVVASFFFLTVYYTTCQLLRGRFPNSMKWLSWVVLRSRRFTLLGKRLL